MMVLHVINLCSVSSECYQLTEQKNRFQDALIVFKIRHTILWIFYHYSFCGTLNLLFILPKNETNIKLIVVIVWLTQMHKNKFSIN